MAGDGSCSSQRSALGLLVPDPEPSSRKSTRCSGQDLATRPAPSAGAQGHCGTACSWCWLLSGLLLPWGLVRPGPTLADHFGLSHQQGS